MRKIKVMIADDSVVYRSQIRAALQGIGNVEVTGAASNGRLALEKIGQSAPDALVLDLEMPEMDGIETLKALKANGFGGKVLVFSSTSRRGAETTLEALRLGAADFIAKPGPGEGGGGDPADRIRALLEPRLAALFPEPVSAAAPVAAAAAPRTALRREGPECYVHPLWPVFQPEVVVIGSSTGGPNALEHIFTRLSGSLSRPILIAQHMPPLFTAMLSERLHRLTGIAVREGVNGEAVESGRVYVAPGGFHMTIAGDRSAPIIRLDEGPLVNSVRPAVDPLFDSAVEVYGKNCLALVLTGMGADGRSGAETIKRAGGTVLIQEESSCVVFGMPGAVKNAGAFDRELGLDDLAAAILEKAFTGVGKSPAIDPAAKKAGVK